MDIIAIIQARVGSTRLKGKVLLDLKGKTVIERVIERVSQSKKIDDIVLATVLDKENLKLVNIAASMGIKVYCGSENDVLDRYYQVAKLLKAKHVVRITSDCPLIDSCIIDEVIGLHLDKKADFTSNALKGTYPDGLDVEVMKFEALKKAWGNARLQSEREHVAAYITKNPGIFKLENLEYKENLYSKRWTLDNPEDYKFIKKIYDNLYDKNPAFKMQDILKFLRNTPGIEVLNKNIKRNEGYIKSLKSDRVLDIE